MEALLNCSSVKEALDKFKGQERIDFLLDYLQGDSEGFKEVLQKEI